MTNLCCFIYMHARTLKDFFQFIGQLEFSCPLNLKVSGNASQNVAVLRLIPF